VDLQSTPGAGTTAALEIPDGPQALGGSGLNHDGSGATGVGTIGFAQRVLLMCAILAGPAAPALAATVAVRAVRVNGVPVPGGPSQIVSAAPGDQLDIELHLEDWAPHHLRGYQLRLDPASLRGGAAGALSVLAGSCSIQALRPDFVFAGFSVDPAAGEAFAAMDTAASVCRWTAGLIDAASSVSGAGPKYLAEVTLQVSADAAGGFAVALDPAATFLRNDAAPAAPIEPLELQSLVVMLGGCAGAADCADLDSDGVRDDNCLWWSCAAGACASVEIGFGDVGGQFGACQPDGATDGNDRFHVLNCFSNQDTAGGAGYPCEASPPQAFNTDPGGQFGSCQPDGICDGNDAFHTLNAFQHTTTCACPEGPAPRSPDSPPLVVAGARLSLKPSRTALRSTETVDVDVCLDTPLADLRGYQLHLSAAGGESGRLELVDIALPAGGVFAANAASNLAGAGFKDATAAAFWSAFNRATGQMLAGLDTAGVHAPPGSRLATYTYRASADAAGTFVVSLLADDSDPRQRTYLFPTPARGKIALASPAPVKLVITRRSLRAGQ
jgi:hypothetical protein